MELVSEGSRATLVPERGALVSQWSVGGAPLFYLDESTLRDPSKNVRGGNPVLFPSPGKLRDDRYAHGTLKQHGFARNLPWRVEGHSEAAALLSLQDDEHTRASYPWRFRAELRFFLFARALRIEQRVHNRDDKPMPFGFGFHPYFAVPVEEKRTAVVETSATRAFDNVHKRVIDLRGIDLAGGEVDLHLLDHNRSDSRLRWSHTVRIDASPDYRRWVIWTLPDKPFVCLEPWTSAGDALNTGEGLITLPPDETWSGFVEYSLAP